MPREKRSGSRRTGTRVSGNGGERARERARERERKSDRGAREIEEREEGGYEGEKILFLGRYL